VTTRLREPILRGAMARAAFDELFALRERYGFLLLAFAFMPDHAHFVVVSPSPNSIQQLMRLIKGALARRINHERGSSGSVWQRGFFDKSPRDLPALNAFIGYTESNPVRAGLVRHARDYEFCSADGRCMADYHAFFDLEQA
jgi:REP element-mobilizing transposase RayT